MALRRGQAPRGGVWIAALVVYPVLYAVGVATPQDPLAGIANAVLVSCTYQVFYVALSLAVFARAPGDAFADSSAPTGRLRGWATGDQPGLAQALSLGAIAMGTAIWVVPRTERFAGELPLAVVAVGSIGLIVGAWASTVVTYAIDYARAHAKTGGLEFPGGPPHDFTDYLYLAVVVSTSFSAGDVPGDEPATAPEGGRSLAGGVRLQHDHPGIGHR